MLSLPTQSRSESGVGNTPINAPMNLDGTWIKTNADALNPGEWHYSIGASIPDGFSNFTELVNAGSDAAGTTTSSNIFWGPIALWNPDDTKSYMIADRTSGTASLHAVSFFGYDAQNHAFVQYPAVDRSDLDFGSPHVYGKWTLDTSRQNFYRVGGGGYSFDVPTQAWTSTGDFISWSVGNRMSSYFKDIDRVVALNDSGSVEQWNPDTSEISTLSSESIQSLADAANGHGHSVYNQTRQEVAFWADKTSAIGIVDTAGTLSEGVALPYTDQTSTFATSYLFYDPISGHYLVFLQEDQQLWEYDPVGNQWALALDMPGQTYSFPVFQGHLIIVIQELNTILWLHKSGGDDHRLYKHSAVL